REDHARVPARTHQSCPRHFFDKTRAVLRRRLLQLVDDGARREREIRSGVPVGDRVDVEVVDALPVPFERLEGPAREPLHGRELRHAEDLLTSWILTSTSATRRPVRRSTWYLTRLRSVEATSARLRPYSTTTVSSIVMPSSALPPTVMPWRSRSRERGRPRGA